MPKVFNLAFVWCQCYYIGEALFFILGMALMLHTVSLSFSFIQLSRKFMLSFHIIFIWQEFLKMGLYIWYYIACSCYNKGGTIMTGNREYKSDVFSMLMEDPDNALSLYNAMNHSNYTDPGLVEMCTLDRGISLTVHNDASFVLDMNLSIYEHQSTICPNMPVRSLIYFTIILEGMLKNKNLYGRKLNKIPTPRFAEL